MAHTQFHTNTTCCMSVEVMARQVAWRRRTTGWRDSSEKHRQMRMVSTIMVTLKLQSPAPPGLNQYSIQATRAAAPR